jgi:hypothetical protein
MGSYGLTLLGDMRSVELSNQSPEASLINPATMSRSYKIVKAGTYAWTLSGSGTGEYYFRTAAAADTGLEPPTNIYQNNVVMVGGTIGSLAVSQWAWGDNDTLGYNTNYVRLSDSADPDSKADGYLCMLSPVWGLHKLGYNPYRDAHKPWVVFPAGDTTPDVSGGNIFRFNNVVPTVVTNFRNGTDGQVIHVFWTEDSTSIDFTATNLKGHGGVDFIGDEDDCMTCFFCKGIGADNLWYCIVSDNSPP